MKPYLGISLVASLFILAACDSGRAPDPSGGAAGDMGPGYCDAPPAQADQLEHWNQTCMPARR